VGFDRSWIKNTEILFLALVLSVCGLETASAAPCQVPGSEAVGVARNNGFNFLAELSRGTPGSCLRGGDGLVEAAAGNTSGPIECKATFFAGRKLASPWKLVDAVMEVEVRPGGRRENLSPEIKNSVLTRTFKVEQGTNAFLQLKHITLEGPDCSKWKDAFAKSTPP
jgi:hypothetical protein